MRFLQSKTLQYIITGAVAILLMQLLPIPQSYKTLINLVGIYAIIALGFNILLGCAGQISLGHAAFMGLGAYVAAFAVNQLQLPFLVALLLSGLVPLLVGLLLGLVALRLEGIYLAIATMGLGIVAQKVFAEWVGFTNGYQGVRIKYPEIFGYQFKSREDLFAIIAVVVVLLAIFSHNFLKNKTGRALVAMRDCIPAAQAMGVSLFKYKMIAFAISAFYAGVSGCLYLTLLRFVEPYMWGVELSLNLLAIVVIGGLASIGGSILGAAYIILLPEILKLIPLFENIKNLSFIFNGVLIIVVMVFLPGGLISIFGRFKHLIVARKFKNTAEAVQEGQQQ